MKEFELTLLLNDELVNDYDNVMAEIVNKVAELGGKITKVENDGRKRLAYPILDNEYAIYVYCDVELEDETPVKLSNWLNIYDPVLRYLLVRK